MQKQKLKKTHTDRKEFQEYLDMLEESDCITTRSNVSEVYVTSNDFTADGKESLRKITTFKFTDESVISRLPGNLQDEFDIEKVDELLAKFTPPDDPKKQPKKEKNPPKPKRPLTPRDIKRTRIWNLYSQGVEIDVIKKMKIAVQKLN